VPGHNDRYGSAPDKGSAHLLVQMQGFPALVSVHAVFRKRIREWAFLGGSITKLGCAVRTGRFFPDAAVDWADSQVMDGAWVKMCETEGFSASGPGQQPDRSRDTNTEEISGEGASVCPLSFGPSPTRCSSWKSEICSLLRLPSGSHLLCSRRREAYSRDPVTHCLRPDEFTWATGPRNRPEVNGRFSADARNCLRPYRVGASSPTLQTRQPQRSVIRIRFRISNIVGLGVSRAK
jgi:hypothetical protein